MGQTGRESVERWVTWVIGHKIWPIVSSNVCLIGLHMDQLCDKQIIAVATIRCQIKPELIRWD